MANYGKKQLTFNVTNGSQAYTHYLSVDSTTNLAQATHNGTSIVVGGSGGRLVTITVAAVADWKAIEAFQAAYNTLMADSQLTSSAVDIDTSSIDPSAVVVS